MCVYKLYDSCFASSQAVSAHRTLREAVYWRVVHSVSTMAGSHKILKIFLLLSGILHVCRPQTFDELSQNFCQTRGGGSFQDNFSCRDEPIEEGECFNLDKLCDGNRDCTDGEDEGDNDVFSPLECKFKFVVKS